MEIGKAVKEVKAGKIDFKVDKTGIIHASIGKVSFDAKKIQENAQEFLNTVIKLKPQALKGTYIKSITPVSYTHLRAHENPEHLVCRLLLEKKKTIIQKSHLIYHDLNLHINDNTPQ